MKVISLFSFWGHGDSLGVTWAPRLIKQRYKENIFIRFIVKGSHRLYFESNPYVDEIVTISDEEAVKYKRSETMGLFENELNIWCGANKSERELLGFKRWDIPFESAKILNKRLNKDVAHCSDPLLPELYYSLKERDSIRPFILSNSQYVVIETECFSGQHHLSAKNAIETIGSPVRNKKFNLFTSVISSSLSNEEMAPFKNLNNFNLRQVGLIIEGAQAFYGLSSGLTVVSLETSLKHLKRRVIACPEGVWSRRALAHNPKNLVAINSLDYIRFILDDLKSLGEKWPTH